MPTWTQLWPIRLIAGGGGAGFASWLEKTKENVTVTPKVNGVATALTTESLGVSQAPLLLVTRVDSNLLVAEKNVGTIQPVTGEAFTLEPTLRGILSTPTEAMQVASTTIDLTQTTYCLTSSSNGTWANPTNAQGPNDGAQATNTNTLLAAGSGALTLAYASQFNKTELVISDAELKLYWGSTAALAGPATNLVQYSLDAGATWTTIITTRVAQTFTSTPQTFSLTSAVGQSWANLTDLRVRFTFTAASGLPSTASVDAVKLIVQATQTVLS